METLIIRKGIESDLQDIHRLVGELARYEHGEAEFTATLLDYIRDFRDGVFQTLVAESGGRIIGMALYYLTYSTWKGTMLYLEDVVVEEYHRRHGIGHKLFRAFLEEANQLNCRLVKWQVLDWNEPAVRFYKKIGATIEKDWWNGKIIFEPGRNKI